MAYDHHLPLVVIVIRRLVAGATCRQLGAGGHGVF
jgi:hypothetical protein